MTMDTLAAVAFPPALRGPARAAPAAARPRAGAAKAVLASFIGTTIEWYDFFLYGTAAALVFNRLFFPSFDPLTGIMASFGAYAVGFFARPIGGVVFGHYGDRLGRKSMLVLSLVLMGTSTFLIGLLPTYEQAGCWAPIALVVLRFVQGFGVGGEWGGAVLMASEHAGESNRGLCASWPQAGVPAGMLLATGVFSAFSRLPEPEFLAWGWRGPFLLGLLLVLVGFYIRTGIQESEAFAKAKEDGVARYPVLDAIRLHPRAILLAAGSRLAENASFYLFSVFVLTYATAQRGLPAAWVLRAILAASALQLATIPFFGWLSDRWGRRPVYLAGAAGTGAWGFAFFALIDVGTPGSILLAVSVGLGLCHAAMYGPQAAFFSELFGTKVRYSGASLGYQLASPLAGGLAPLIATALLSRAGGRPWTVAGYLACLCLLSFASILAARETSRTRLQG